jgi:hypothetical protein
MHMNNYYIWVRLIMYISRKKEDVTEGWRELNYGELHKCISHKMLLGRSNQGE